MKDNLYKTIAVYSWQNRLIEHFGIKNIRHLLPTNLWVGGKYLQQEQRYFPSISRLLKHITPRRAFSSVWKKVSPYSQWKNSTCHWNYKEMNCLRMLIFVQLSLSLSLSIFISSLYYLVKLGNFSGDLLNPFYILCTIAP